MKKYIALLVVGVIFLSSCNLSEPYADFDISEFSVPAGSSFEFYNNSRNATTCFWDFGDGETSTEWSPLHIYEKSGTYTVTLTVYNKNESKSDAFYMKVFVKDLLGIQVENLYLTDYPLTDSTGKSWDTPPTFPYIYPMIIQNGDTLLNSQYWIQKTTLPFAFYSIPNNIFLDASKGPCRFELWTSNYADTVLMGSAILNINDSIIRPYLNSVTFGEGDVKFELYYSKEYLIPEN